MIINKNNPYSEILWQIRQDYKTEIGEIRNTCPEANWGDYINALMTNNPFQLMPQEIRIKEMALERCNVPMKNPGVRKRV